MPLADVMINGWDAAAAVHTDTGRADASVLKPCPFCGGRAAVVQDRATGWWFVRCAACHAGGSGDQEQACAVRRWNRRVGEL